MLSNVLSSIAIFLSACGLIFNLFLYLERKKSKQLSIDFHLKTVSVLNRDFGSYANSLFISAIVENNSSEGVSINKLVMIGTWQGEEHTLEAEFSKRLISTLKYEQKNYPLYTNEMPINIPANTGKPIIIEFRFKHYIDWFLHHNPQIEISTNKGQFTVKPNLKDSKMSFDDFSNYENVL